MSRKTRRNQPDPAPPVPAPGRLGRRSIVVVLVVALVALVAGILLQRSQHSKSAESDSAARQAALASAHSPTLGDAGAKVHVVEFLDPACETCAAMYPLVKQVMAANPGKIRLSVRHVAFHSGSDTVLRILEASRAQDKYWETLEALLGSQSQWTMNHTAHPDLARIAIAGVGLDDAQLLADMNSPEVAQRIQQDANDAVTMKVTATPEYFVNGRPMPSFGEQQLLSLIREELQRAD